MLVFRTIFFHNFPEAKLTLLLLPNRQPTHRLFFYHHEKDRMQILIFKNPEPAIVDMFARKMTKAIKSITEIVAFRLTRLLN